ncbi:1-deoxy-D-xylulose-5-phosphate reductoisomerase [Ramlibacter tataouinensis]|uniref:1-deoxy-D-xylulose 5-phosphate reductoisomerase n=1 Tax=Ramlibacter tataouinensis (strain ATCC BAA-407 / DSM 14655 / LMG 21543 / TTB310) TaxID=365046 RepID=F5XVS6_RAMTT|nr:1-deoxy-D-xylulose-5-phosphate reductoisomerase [Ramlibacter tataouinensis]AEG92839.1 1-deoxyxylulose-5-phosphate reductoisomerase [Ramlibacter tataouinensis TTB310]
MDKQRIAVLGSTGSVGASTLDVVARHPDRFEVFALCAATRVDEMLAQCRRFRPQVAVMADEAAGRELARQLEAHGLPTRVEVGPSAVDAVASHEAVHIVMAAIVGAAGLSSCLAAARAGKRLLLANKEALVVGGEVFLAAVREGGATLLPIDSEHSAIFQSLPEDPASWDERVEKIILTASGGPFRTRDPASLRQVTPEEACAHPNWVMGRKISVDSATMMNKALEVIEARYLFGLPPERLEVVIHPQSVIHSMVQYRDSSVVAQLGTPDMRVPIAYGLAWPGRVASGAQALDFSRLADMSFEAVDSRGHRDRFPGLQLAWDCLRAPAGTTAVLNAANEVAVAAFLDRRIRFDQIHALNLATLEAVPVSKPRALGDLLELDGRARRSAEAGIARLP